ALSSLLGFPAFLAGIIVALVGSAAVPHCGDKRRDEEATPMWYDLIQRFLREDDGPTAVEYAVMLALIIVVCIGAITTLGSNANKTFTTVGQSVNVGS